MLSKQEDLATLVMLHSARLIFALHCRSHINSAPSPTHSYNDKAFLHSNMLFSPNMELQLFPFVVQHVFVVTRK